jgi:protein-S-isoprenylcysteine O-methyltransferase Ste14
MRLLVQSFAGFVFLAAVMGAVVFGAAGTFAYWQGWALLGVFFGCAGVISVWLFFNDKALLERRVKAGPGAESDPMQNVAQALAGLVFLGTIALPALDHRLGWSCIPVAVEITGDALIAVGFLAVFLVFRENTFTAGTIEIAEGQRVIDTGPYALVRHPMYAGALLLFVGMPLALGSWWGLIVGALIVPILGWRLIREEAFLAEHLPGYGDYRLRVRYRLAPLVW